MGRKVRGQRAFLSMIDDKPSIEKEARRGIVCNACRVRLREKPSLDADVISTLHIGDEVEILDVDGSFFKVDAGLVGYIHQDYCEEVVESG